MKTLLLRQPDPISLLNRLIDSPALVRGIRDLPPLAFSKLIQHVGVEDAGELVALATTDQLVNAFDEDLFRNSRPGNRESFDPIRFVTWLEVLLEAGDDVAARRLTELSEDFVTHAINSLVLVLHSDALRLRMSEGDDHAVIVDKALESAICEEIEGYLLVARSPDGWDTVFALILALDRDHRSFLERILNRCARISRELVDDLDALSTVLSAGASLAEDVEAEREERRGRCGFVEPRAARAFLALARSQTDPAQTERDPITHAYFRDLKLSGHAPLGAGPRHDTETLLRLLDRVAETQPKPRGALLPGHAEPEKPETMSPITEAMQALRDLDARMFQERKEELAYLANALVAGATIDGRRFRPSEAMEAALATVALGAEIEARVKSPSVKPSTPAELCAVLTKRTSDLLFRVASSALAGRASGSASVGFLRDRRGIKAALRNLGLIAQQHTTHESEE